MEIIRVSFVVIVLVIVVLCTEGVQSEDYIIGGNTAKRNAFPFLVSLRDRRHIHNCAAGILSDHWLLSAASCTYGELSNSSNVVAVIGAHHRKNDGFNYTIDTITNHPQFNPVNHWNDISVLRTVRQIVLTVGRVQPLRLPTENFNDTAQPRTRLWIGGWGLTNIENVNNSGIHPHLQYATSWSISLNECHQLLHRRNHYLSLVLSRRKVCSITENGQGTCRGDTGGPIVDDNGVCIGIISSGIPCSPQLPDVHTRTWSYLTFIFTNTDVKPRASNTIRNAPDQI